MIHQVKTQTPIDALCVNLPNEFQRYFERVRDLAFDEEPPYTEFREMFRKLFVRFRFVCDYEFDWMEQLGPYIKLAKVLVKNKEKSMVCGRLCPLSTQERMLRKVREMRVYAKPSEMWGRNSEPRKRKLARGIACSCSYGALETLPNVDDRKEPRANLGSKFTASLPDNLVLASVKRMKGSSLLGQRLSPLCNPANPSPIRGNADRLPSLDPMSPIIVPPPPTPEPTKLPSIDLTPAHKRIKLSTIRKL